MPSFVDRIQDLEERIKKMEALIKELLHRLDELEAAVNFLSPSD